MSRVDTSLIGPDLVFMDVWACDARELFAWLEPVYLDRGLVREGWLEAICAREEAYPTGLTFDSVAVAIPHVEPEHIASPYISVIRPRGTVRFGGMGGMPEVDAQLVVNLGLQAHEEDQVLVVQALMGVFARREAVEEIMSATTREDVAATMRRWCQECSA